MSLTSCETNSLAPVIGNKVYVTECMKLWSEIDVNKAMKEYENCDILTEDTARDILNNNEKIEQNL